MKKWVKKPSLFCKIGVKGREKDRSRPLKDKKGHFKFGPSFKGNIQKRMPQHHCRTENRMQKRTCRLRHRRQFYASAKNNRHNKLQQTTKIECVEITTQRITYPVIITPQCNTLPQFASIPDWTDDRNLSLCQNNHCA
jgi:hypothetical protein